MPPSRLVADYPSVDSFLSAVDLEISNGGLLVRGARPESGGECVVEVRLVGRPLAEVEGRVEAVGRSGVAVTFDDVPFELVAAADRLRRGEALDAVLPSEKAEKQEESEAPRGTVAERLAQLTVPQKIQQALSGDREVRLHLLRDQNKVLHGFVLKNPRVQLDEVLWAAKLPTLASDALQFIGDHKEWGQNLQICCALVRNPHSPAPLALRLLPRLPQGELRAIAKGGARDQIVHAARKLLAGP